MEFLFWILVGCLGAYEVLAMSTHHPGDTISEIIWRISQNRPIVPFLFGLLMGHFFFTRVNH